MKSSDKDELISCDLLYIEKWDKVFNNRPTKICGRQPLKNFKGYGLLNHTSERLLLIIHKITKLKTRLMTWLSSLYFSLWVCSMFYFFQRTLSQKKFRKLLSPSLVKFCPYLFHEGGPYHIETSPLICSAYQCTGFYMIGTSVMNKLNVHQWRCSVSYKNNILHS